MLKKIMTQGVFSSKLCWQQVLFDFKKTGLSSDLRYASVMCTGLHWSGATGSNHDQRDWGRIGHTLKDQGWNLLRLCCFEKSPAQVDSGDLFDIYFPMNPSPIRILLDRPWTSLRFGEPLPKHWSLQDIPFCFFYQFCSFNGFNYQKWVTKQITHITIKSHQPPGRHFRWRLCISAPSPLRHGSEVHRPSWVEHGQWCQGGLMWGLGWVVYTVTFKSIWSCHFGHGMIMHHSAISFNILHVECYKFRSQFGFGFLGWDDHESNIMSVAHARLQLGNAKNGVDVDTAAWWWMWCCIKVEETDEKSCSVYSFYGCFLISVIHILVFSALKCTAHWAINPKIIKDQDHEVRPSFDALRPTWTQHPRHPLRLGTFQMVSRYWVTDAWKSHGSNYL